LHAFPGQKDFFVFGTFTYSTPNGKKTLSNQAQNPPNHTAGSMIPSKCSMSKMQNTSQNTGTRRLTMVAATRVIFSSDAAQRSWLEAKRKMIRT
jgi:hypothetical protein